MQARSLWWLFNSSSLHISDMRTDENCMIKSWLRAICSMINILTQVHTIIYVIKYFDIQIKTPPFFLFLSEFHCLRLHRHPAPTVQRFQRVKNDVKIFMDGEWDECTPRTCVSRVACVAQFRSTFKIQRSTRRDFAFEALSENKNRKRKKKNDRWDFSDTRHWSTRQSSIRSPPKYLVYWLQVEHTGDYLLKRFSVRARTRKETEEWEEI